MLAARRFRRRANFRLAVTESSTNVPLAIPDNGNVNSTLNFSVAGTITDANLTVDIAHTWNDDIELRLTSPSVAVQLLWLDCGGSGDNTQVTIDQDAAALSTCPNAGPITGTFLPTNGTAVVSAATGNMDAFNGSASAGVWTLNVTDDLVHLHRHAQCVVADPGRRPAASGRADELRDRMTPGASAPE